MPKFRSRSQRVRTLELNRVDKIKEQKRLENAKMRNKQNAAALAAKAAGDYKRRYDKEMKNRRKMGIKGPLLTNTNGDVRASTMELTSEFNRRFGEQVPIWYIGGLDEAKDEAYGSQMKAQDRRMLGIYIHHERSIQSNVFCSQILCAESIVQFLSENCICWGWDITELENRTQLFLQIGGLFGESLVNQLKRLSTDEFPIVLIANGRGASSEVTEVIKGSTDINNMMSRLISAQEIANRRKTEDIQFEMVREQRQSEIREQEDAYEQSCRADQIKMAAVQEEAEKKRVDEERKKREEEAAAKHEAEMKDKLPAEPPQGNGVCQLRFRLPNGQNIVRRFLPTDRIQLLFMFMGSEGFSESSHRLLRQFPRMDLSTKKRSVTLDSLGLKQDTLVIEPMADGEDSDESDDDSDMEE